MDLTVLLIFGLVYLGMIVGEFPGLALDRTGVALLGAIALLVAGRITPEAAWLSIDVATMGLLFGLMIVSAQFRLGGFYMIVTRRLADAEAAPRVLLALTIAVSGILSALLANDIVCLAMTPILIEGCARRRLDPVPFALALACAANVGSAATLIGNPQNMLIGQTLHLSFARYLGIAAVPALLGMVIVWWIIDLLYRGRWEKDSAVTPAEPESFNAYQTGKGLLILAALMIAFLIAPWPREILALCAAGILLTSRRLASRDILGLVDWHLLVLFFGLFIVNRALADSGMLTAALGWAEHSGMPLARPAWLMSVTVALSNLVSNVPAVMLLLPVAKTAAAGPFAGPILALASTLAGNLFVVGSIANIIVIDQARRQGVRIGWRDHARVGIPVTLLTLGVAAGWLWLLGNE